MLGLSNRGQHKKLRVPSRPIRAAVSKIADDAVIFDRLSHASPVWLEVKAGTAGGTWSSWGATNLPKGIRPHRGSL